MRSFSLQIIGILLLFSLTNLIIGTNGINQAWEWNTFICNMKIPGPTDICDKKIGFFFSSLVLSIPLLAGTIGFISKNLIQSVLAPILTVILWSTFGELFSRLFSTPTLYSFERSSLHYGFLSVFPAWWEFFGLPLLVFSGVVIFFGLIGFYIKILALTIRKRFE